MTDDATRTGSGDPRANSLWETIRRNGGTLMLIAGFGGSLMPDLSQPRAGGYARCVRVERRDRQRDPGSYPQFDVLMRELEAGELMIMIKEEQD